jgi:hypothetical protein
MTLEEFKAFELSKLRFGHYDRDRQHNPITDAWLHFRDRGRSLQIRRTERVGGYGYEVRLRSGTGDLLSSRRFSALGDNVKAYVLQELQRSPEEGKSPFSR